MWEVVEFKRQFINLLSYSTKRVSLCQCIGVDTFINCEIYYSLCDNSKYKYRGSLVQDSLPKEETIKTQRLCYHRT